MKTIVPLTIVTMSNEVLKNRSRALVFLHPKEGVSFEDFDRYWLNPHGDLFKNLPYVKKNYVKYEQYHYNMEVNHKLAEMGLFKSPYYGVAVFEAETDEQILDILQDPDYQKIIQPDEAKFFDNKKIEIIMGKVAVLIDKTGD